jgi:hypothetical protein
LIVGALDPLKFWTALKLLLAGLLLKHVMQIIGVLLAFSSIHSQDVGFQGSPFSDLGCISS